MQTIPFLDHGWAPNPEDRELMENKEFLGRIGIVMFDASAYQLQENIALKHDCVDRHENEVVVEGCSDKILSQADLTAQVDKA